MSTYSRASRFHVNQHELAVQYPPQAFEQAHIWMTAWPAQVRLRSASGAGVDRGPRGAGDQSCRSRSGRARRRRGCCRGGLRRAILGATHIRRAYLPSTIPWGDSHCRKEAVLTSEQVGKCSQRPVRLDLCLGLSSEDQVGERRAEGRRQRFDLLRSTTVLLSACIKASPDLTM